MNRINSSSCQVRVGNVYESGIELDQIAHEAEITSVLEEETLVVERIRLASECRPQTPTTTYSVSKKGTFEPDGGWAWVILAASFYISLVNTSFLTSFGIQFGRFLTDLSASTTVTTMIANTHLLSSAITPLIGGPLVLYFGSRKVGIVFTSMASVFYFLLVFANSPIYVWYTYGIGLGTASGLTLTNLFVTLPHYFVKYRGFALGMLAVSISVGQIVVPLLTRYLLHEFGFRGTVLIQTGIVLNTVVAASLLRPFEESEPLTVVTRGPDRVNDEENQALRHKEASENKVNLSTELKRNFKRALQGLGSFRIIVYSLGVGMFLSGYLNFMALLPFYINDEGYSFGDAALSLACVAVTSTVTRLLISMCADRAWFARTKVYLFMSCVASVMCLSVIFLMFDLRFVWSAMLFYGTGVGAMNSLRVIVLIDFIGMENYVPAFCANGVILSMIHVTLGPLGGIVRDLSSSYPATICFHAGLQLMLPLLGLLMPCASAADRRRAQRSQKQEEQTTTLS